MSEEQQNGLCGQALEERALARIFGGGKEGFLDPNATGRLNPVTTTPKKSRLPQPQPSSAERNAKTAAKIAAGQVKFNGSAEKKVDTATSAKPAKMQESDVAKTSSQSTSTDIIDAEPSDSGLVQTPEERGSKTNPPRTRPKSSTKKVVVVAPHQKYVGEVVKLLPVKPGAADHFGFLSCAAFDRDVFVSVKQVEEHNLQLGQTVTFYCEALRGGKLRCREVL